MAFGDDARAVHPTIILLHGFGQQGDSWSIVADALERDGWDVMTPDLPALMCAAGDPFDAVCVGVGKLVRDVLAKTGTRPFLVGYSMGGRIALESALRTLAADSILPIAGVALESSGLGPNDERERKALCRRNEEWAARVREEGVETFMEWWEGLPLFASQRALPDGVRAVLKEGRLRNDAETLALELSGWGQHAQAGKAASLAGLNGLAGKGVAVAYFAGLLDQKYSAFAEEIRAAVPSASVVVFPGVGHNIHLENPEGFVRALERWCENALRRLF